MHLTKNIVGAPISVMELATLKNLPPKFLATLVFKTRTTCRSPMHFRTIVSQDSDVHGVFLSEGVQYVKKKIYSIYKYLPKYICRNISTIQKTNIGAAQLPDKDPFLCNYVHPIRLLLMELEQLLEMTKLVPRLVLCAEVFRNHIEAATLGGLATSGECLQLQNRLLWKPQRLLLQKIHDHHMPQRLRRLIHKYIGPPLLNGSTSLPPNHNNSHPPFLYKPSPPWRIETTKQWTPCPMLLLCFPTPLSFTQIEFILILDVW